MMAGRTPRQKIIKKVTVSMSVIHNVTVALCVTLRVTSRHIRLSINVVINLARQTVRRTGGVATPSQGWCQHRDNQTATFTERHGIEWLLYLNDRMTSQTVLFLHCQAALLQTVEQFCSRSLISADVERSSARFVATVSFFQSLRLATATASCERFMRML